MSLDKKAIETLSVNAVKNSIVTSEFLDQFIADNDKEPSWDGAVYIYGDKSKKKSTLRGRMPVQIKGVECGDFSKDEISFQMSKDDLRNYLYDGGCMLFVVYLGNVGADNKIYYAELTPIKLRQLLEGKNKSKAIHLKTFPIDGNKKATIFLNCLQNCKKQASFTEGKLLSLEELEKQGVLENLVIPFEGVGFEPPQKAILTNEIYVYAKIKGSTIPQPLDLIPRVLNTKQTIAAPVMIGDRLFYTEYSIINYAGSTSFCFGESFTITFTSPDVPCNVKYKQSNKIRVLVKDLDFMISYMEKGEFRVNDTVFPFDYDGVKLIDFDLNIEKERLEYVKQIVKVLDLLRCEDDIIISQLTGEDWRNINRLIEAFIDKKPIAGLRHDIPPICCMKISNLRFVLYFKKCIQNGVYEIYDFFKSEFSVICEYTSGNRLPVSQFFILHANDLLTVSNIDYDVILPSFQATEYHFNTYSCANEFLLDALTACDKATGERKNKLLKLCDDFSKWIFSAPNEALGYAIRLLNRLQVVKRQRNLNIDEISLLYELIEHKETSEETRIGAYLLLGQQQPAKIHFGKLNDTEIDNFKKYPIYHFWETEYET